MNLKKKHSLLNFAVSTWKLICNGTISKLFYTGIYSLCNFVLRINITEIKLYKLKRQTKEENKNKIEEIKLYRLKFLELNQRI